jgi:[acyl-carrier-protein] S-malonyltransferase
MGSAFARVSPAAKALFHTADTLLGCDLSEICFNGPEERLKQTDITQPALFTTSCAALVALKERISLTPFAVAGHSVGEYAAHVAAGTISFEKGLRLVHRRAQLMQEAAAARPGTMSAVLGLDPEQVRKAVETARSKGIVAVANYNSPGQVVISGETEAVAAAEAAALELGAKRCIRLPVSGAFHSPLMAAAGDALYPALREAQFGQAIVPVVVNVSAEYCRMGVDFAPYLTMQVSGSVRWEESMQLLVSDGVDTVLELGSGDVLCGLMKRIDRSVRCIAVQDEAGLDAAVEALKEG